VIERSDRIDYLSIIEVSYLGVAQWLVVPRSIELQSFQKFKNHEVVDNLSEVRPVSASYRLKTLAVV
jgi:hypothetical protein